MTDKDRLDVWNKVCLKNGWSKPYELEKWIISTGARFTGGGSIVPENTIILDNKYNIELQVMALDGEALATLVLEAMIGIITFPSLESEEIFWKSIKNKFKELHEVNLPNEIIPGYIRNSNKI